MQPFQEYDQQHSEHEDSSEFLKYQAYQQHCQEHSVQETVQQEDASFIPSPDNESEISDLPDRRQGHLQQQADQSRLKPEELDEFDDLDDDEEEEKEQSQLHNLSPSFQNYQGQEEEEEEAEEGLYMQEEQQQQLQAELQGQIFSQQTFQHQEEEEELEGEEAEEEQEMEQPETQRFIQQEEEQEFEDQQAEESEVEQEENREETLQMQAKFDRLLAKKQKIEQMDQEEGETPLLNVIASNNSTQETANHLQQFKNKNLELNMQKFKQAQQEFTNEEIYADKENMGEQSINLQINANGDIIPTLMPLESIREEETERRDRSLKKDQMNPKMRLQARPMTGSRKTFVGKKQNQTPERQRNQRGAPAAKPQQNFLRASRPMTGQKPVKQQRPQTAKPKQSKPKMEQLQEKITYKPQMPSVEQQKVELSGDELQNEGLENLKQYVRPMTAAIRKQPSSMGTNQRGFIKKPQKKLKKSDPVSRFQNLQNNWKGMQVGNGKQGRKLNLESFNRWQQACKAYNEATGVKKGQQKKFAAGKAPTENRRDDLRFQLRAKLAQQDYCDKELKSYHYKEEIVAEGKNKDKQKIDALKKQIEMLKLQVEKNA